MTVTYELKEEAKEVTRTVTERTIVFSDGSSAPAPYDTSRLDKFVDGLDCDINECYIVDTRCGSVRIDKGVVCGKWVSYYKCTNYAQLYTYRSDSVSVRNASAFKLFASIDDAIKFVSRKAKKMKAQKI